MGLVVMGFLHLRINRQLLPAPPQLLPTPIIFCNFTIAIVRIYIKGKLGFFWICENGEEWWWVMMEELQGDDIEG